MSLKDDWKEAGIGLGRSFAGAAQAVLRSAEVGLARAEDKTEATQPEQPSLKESWTEVGHSFGDAGKALGKAAAGTARRVADAIDGEEKPQS